LASAGPGIGRRSYLSSILTEIGLSLFAADGFFGPRFVGFANYAQAAGHRLLGGAPEQRLVRRRNSLRKLIFALIAALLLNGQFRGRTVFRAVFFLPVILSFVAIGLLWTLIFNYNYGLINFVLQAVGLPDLSAIG